MKFCHVEESVVTYRTVNNAADSSITGELLHHVASCVTDQHLSIITDRHSDGKTQAVRAVRLASDARHVLRLHCIRQ